MVARHGTSRRSLRRPSALRESKRTAKSRLMNGHILGRGALAFAIVGSAPFRARPICKNLHWTRFCGVYGCPREPRSTSEGRRGSAPTRGHETFPALAQLAGHDSGKPPARSCPQTPPAEFATLDTRSAPPKALTARGVARDHQ